MTILFFAQARQATECESIEWEITTPQSVEALWSWLESSYPELATLRKICRLARNEEYLQDADGTALLNPEDVVAIIPPVSGG